jgi:nitrite reductase (NADH) small subunit
MTVNDQEWINVCSVDDVPVLGARVVRRPAAGDIALFRTSEGQVFALLDRCPHKGGPLSQGIVYGERVACPLHNWQIGLADGCAQAPDEGCTRRFDIRTLDNKVCLRKADLHEEAGVAQAIA